jgi:ribosomal protein S3
MGAQMKLDQEFLEKVRGPIHQTWQYIYPDAEVSSNAEAMELVLDANRMEMNLGEKGKAADKLIAEACKEHGYQKVDRFLCKHIKLV